MEGAKQKGRPPRQQHLLMARRRSERRSERDLVFLHLQSPQAGPPDTGIPNKAMVILNSFIDDNFDCIATEAFQLIPYSKKSRAFVYWK